MCIVFTHIIICLSGRICTTSLCTSCLHMISTASMSLVVICLVWSWDVTCRADVRVQHPLPQPTAWHQQLSQACRLHMSLNKYRCGQHQHIAYCCLKGQPFDPQRCCARTQHTLSGLLMIQIMLESDLVTSLGTSACSSAQHHKQSETFPNWRNGDITRWLDSASPALCQGVFQVSSSHAAQFQQASSKH